MLTQERALQVFDYKDGALWWKERAQGRSRTKPAGRETNEGYIQVKVDGIAYQAHRVIWLMCYGRWPEGPLDHKDRNKKNNALENLREVTASENALNRKFPPNKFGLPTGIRFADGKYEARIWVDGKRRTARFTTLDLAVNWRNNQREV